jgi:two-component system sensor histidine kinase HydH
MVGIIIEEVDRLDHVVSQFLGYARPDRGARQSLSVNEIVHATVQLLRSRVGGSHRIETDLASDLPQVRADPDQMRQVFLNLSLNALDVLADGGQLAISTQPRATVLGADTSGVEIAFRDDGPGIAAETLADIFIPFLQRKRAAPA